jgi:hypothetical protein
MFITVLGGGKKGDANKLRCWKRFLILHAVFGKVNPSAHLELS